MLDFGEILCDREVKLVFPDQGFSIDVRRDQILGWICVWLVERHEVVVAPAPDLSLLQIRGIQ